MSSDEVLAKLRSAGWFVIRHRGSHVQLKHPERPGLVTVPVGRKDIPKGTLASIERQAGMSLR